MLSIRKISRRTFLAGAAGVAGSLALPAPAGAGSGLPDPGDSGIEHIIVLMMENRSFDHYLGWLPGADGKQQGLKYLDRNGMAHSTHLLAPDFQGCGHPDPDHSFLGGRVEFAEGRCDGWLLAGRNDVFAIGYYTREDLPFLGEAAPSWTAFDRYFAPLMGPTFPNRLYQHAGVTDRIENSLELTALPTIWDLLAGAGLSGRYYFNDLPVVALWGLKYLPISRSYDQFLADCASGDLPHVAFLDPRFLGIPDGTSADDHPHADIRAGQAFLNEAYSAITSSPAWPETVFIINYDEWGGFFEHVPPTEAPDIDPLLQLRGFRVPVVLISPFARRGFVSHDAYDHTSILKMIEWRWSLPPLSRRDEAANNIAEALDFSTPDLSAPEFSVPPVSGQPCPGAAIAAQGHWAGLRDAARRQGWKL